MLPRQVWLVQAGGVVNSLGNGIVFPFIVIYLHNVRGISFAEAGLALSVGAVAALAAGFGAGTIVDRFGGRNTLLLGLLLQAASFALFPLIREAWQAGALLALEGAGTACFWPGQSTLLSRLTPPTRTHSAFALQRISMNLGLGLGGVIGGLIASTSHPGSFTTLFLLDAATFLVFVAILSTIHEPQVREPKQVDASTLGYRAVLRDRNFVWLLGLNVLFVAVGYEVFALLPPFAKNYAGVSERWVGTMWLANTLLIVLIQLPVSKALEGRRRMRALALMSLLFAAAALIVLGGGARLRLRDPRLRRRRDASGTNAGAARRRPRAGSPARTLLRTWLDVLERRQHRWPCDRRAVAGLAPACRLAARGGDQRRRRHRLPSAGTAVARPSPSLAGRRRARRGRALAEAGPGLHLTVPRL
jgi:predicted MFS family arabinose efflux permease